MFARPLAPRITSLRLDRDEPTVHSCACCQDLEHLQTITPMCRTLFDAFAAGACP